MPTCPSCASSFAAGERFCPRDGVALIGTAEHGVATAPGADDLIGRVLDGRYRLEEKIGAGGMGAVYRARHELMARRVAVKVLRPEVAREEQAERRFRREAKQSSRLDHDNIVRVLDFGRADDGLLYLVMEYLEGKTAGEEIHYDGPMAPRRVAHVCAHVARALAHAHGLGIMHRDLKPDNVMLMRRGADADFAKVLDFGLAKLLERDGERAPGMTAWSIGSLTESGLVFGTPEYMSPEQASGNPLDERTDVYSLGVVAYQMVTGFLPFTGQSFMEILTKHVQEPVIPPMARRPDLAIPAELDRLVVACMAKDPAQRPGSATTLAEAFAEVAASLPAPGARVPTPLAAAATIDLEAASSAMLGGAPPALARDMPTLPGRTLAAAVAPPPARAGTPLPGDVTGRVPRPRRRLAGALAVIAALAAAMAILSFKMVAAFENALPPPPPDAMTEVSETPVTVESPLDAAVTGVSETPVGPPDAGARVVRRRSEKEREADQHVERAAAARAGGNALKQIAEADTALRLDPDNHTAAYLLGDGLLRSGDKANACRYLRRARAQKRARALYNKARCGVD